MVVWSATDGERDRDGVRAIKKQNADGKRSRHDEIVVLCLSSRWWCCCLIMRLRAYLS